MFGSTLTVWRRPCTVSTVTVAIFRYLSHGFTRPTRSESQTLTHTVGPVA